MNFSRRHVWMICAAVLALATLKGAWHVWEVISLEARGAIDSDALLYFTVGRGILNHLTPYVDVFESKPPGMFLIAALSLLTTGSELLALAWQIAIYLLLPVLLGLFAWREAREKEQMPRVSLTLSAGLLGILLSLYLQERAGGIQGESFGTFFALLYFFLMLQWREHLSMIRMSVLGLLLAACIGTKEPFVFTLVAGALLLFRNPKESLRSFVLPLVIGGIIGATVLLLSGFLKPYLSIYIPSMLHGRVDASPVEPLWIRGLSAGRVFGNLTTYYTAPLLGYLLALLWMGIPLFRSQRRPSLADIGLTVTTSAVAYKTIITSFLFLVTWQATRLGLILDQSILPMPGAMFFLLLLVLCGLLFLQWKRAFFTGHLLAIVALYLTTLAVGISIYAVNHFAFALPAFLALAFLFLRYASSEESSEMIVLPVIALIVIAAVAYQASDKHLANMRDRLQYASSAHREQVEKVDALLTSCDVDRYGSLDAFMVLGFARHSPVGPLFVGHFFDYLGKDHPLFSQTRENLTAASIVISAGGEDADRAKELLDTQFTKSPPECAKEYVPIQRLQVYFRK